MSILIIQYPFIIYPENVLQYLKQCIYKSWMYNYSYFEKSFNLDAYVMMYILCKAFFKRKIVIKIPINKYFIAIVECKIHTRITIIIRCVIDF